MIQKYRDEYEYEYEYEQEQEQETQQEKEQKEAEKVKIERGKAKVLNRLYAAYKKEFRALPENKKDQWKSLQSFNALYIPLVEYIEHAADCCNYSYGDVVRDNAIDMALNDILGLTRQKVLLNDFSDEVSESGESKTKKSFSSWCFGIVKNKLLYAERKERNRLVRQYSDNIEELKELRKQSVSEMAARNVPLEESDYYALVEESERIRANPEKVFFKQVYREERIKVLKNVLDIVAKGPLRDSDPVYRNVGGAFGSYLSPVVSYEWQQWMWLKDAKRKKACFLQEIATRAAEEQARQTLALFEGPQDSTQTEERKTTEKSEKELADKVREKLLFQMSQELQEQRMIEETNLRENGVEKNTFQLLMDSYYHGLQQKYQGKTKSGAVTASTWAWHVVSGLTAKEAAWLFQHEMEIGVPVLRFQWDEVFYKKIEALKNEQERFLDVATFDRFENWPKQLQKAVVEHCGREMLVFYEDVLEEMKSARKKLEDMHIKRKGGIGYESV